MSHNQRSHDGFNWATPVKAWRSHHAARNGNVYYKLQLGHAGEGVEIRAFHQQHLPTSTLQLGHAGEGVEIIYLDLR